MSLLYSILKPLVRKAVKGSSLHQEESYEEFKQASYDVQKKFKFRLPTIRGFAFRDEQLDGFHIIVGKKAGSNPDRAVVYFPGGGSRRWQLPFKSSIKHYISETGAELWTSLYPLLPDYDLMDETEFAVRVHERMLRRFKPENIVWLCFSGGADVLMQAGRHMVQNYPELPMPGLMIPVSASGLLMSEEARARMKEIDPRDPLLHWDMFDTMVKYYNPNGDLPQYILGKADEDDYFVMAKSRGIGGLIACEHCRNAVTEMEQIDLFYEELMRDYPKDKLQSWNKLRRRMPSWEELHEKYGD